MLRLTYTLIFIVALPVIFYRLWAKDKKVPGYRIRWPERFGIYPKPTQGTPIVWIHAVSVGEVVAATPLIRRLLQCPDLRLMVTTMTPTGSTRVASTFGSDVLHVYAPYDLPWTVRAFLRRTQPLLTIIMETELWPNMLHECAAQNVPTILANARMSERSALRYLKVASATRKLLNCLSYVAAQTEEDGQRFKRLGLQEEKLVVSGNIKFDMNLSEHQRTQSQALKERYAAQRPIFVAASTHEGEDEILLRAHKKILTSVPEALLIIIPRHPDRFDDVAQLFAAEFRCIRRSQALDPEPSTQVVIGDTMGEVTLFYGIADVAFVGGSLIERGGHNMIEPAYWGLPILSGPYTFNFADVRKNLAACGGLHIVRDEQEIAENVITWLQNPEQAKAVGQSSKAYAEKNRGAVDQMMKTLSEFIDCK